MIKEYGLVVEIKSDQAFVQTVSKTSCSSCQVNSSCGTGLISKAFGEKSFITPMLNSVNSQVGDEVEVGIPENLVVKFSLLVYLLPLSCMILVTLIAQFLLPNFQETFLILTAFISLILGFFVVKLLEQKTSKNSKLEPVLLRIVKRSIPLKQIDTL